MTAKRVLIDRPSRKRKDDFMGSFVLLGSCLPAPYNGTDPCLAQRLVDTTSVFSSTAKAAPQSTYSGDHSSLLTQRVTVSTSRQAVGYHSAPPAGGRVKFSDVLRTLAWLWYLDGDGSEDFLGYKHSVACLPEVPCNQYITPPNSDAPL